MQLTERVTALAAAVRDKLNAMTPRLLPSGGGAGQVLAKSSGTDYEAQWTAIVGGSSGNLDGGTPGSNYGGTTPVDGGTPSSTY